MITVDSLTKTYGKFTAVDDVTFTARPGRVTGFLGPNGAGKSTTMRVMVGLTPPTSGDVTISGRRFRDLPNPGHEVGVLLDASAQHAGRTGREILTITQRTMGLPKRRVEEMLARVSLTDEEAGRRVRNYSLGMRQRLGIATALIGDPEVLILDEPANGLDPAGIRWMRDLLRSYADQGGTVLLSSHLLHEIEVIADDLVLIGDGRIVAQGTKTELLQAAGTVVRTASAGVAHPGTRGRRHRQHSLPRRRPAHQRRPGAGGPGRPRRRSRPHRAPVSRRSRARGDVPRAHRRFTTRRSSSMSTVTAEREAGRAAATTADPAPIPMTRLVGVELRKMFDTRSGFWLMTSIAITALLATGAVILFAPDSEITYNNFAAAIGVPMTIILPIMAILSVTSEWSQRNGLTTFTLVPHRGRVIWAKAISAVGVGVVSIIVAFSIGALGNVVGTTITGTDLVWDLSWENLLYITFANVLGLLMGFMLGVLIRNSAGAIVGYFVYSLVLPTLFGMLASFQEWFRDIQGWVDFQYSSSRLFDGGLSSTEWAHLGVSGFIWLILPMTVGVWLVLRSEIK